MNCNKFIRGIAILCASSFLWVSCQKENINIPAIPIENNANLKLSGAVPDDPALVAKLPLITSADFLANKITNYFSYQPQNESAKGSGSGGGGRDRTTPNVSIITPATGTTVSNTVSVQVSASDNVGVSSVILKVDGTVIGSSTTAPYHFSWNTAGLSSGTHTLTATAADAAGNSKVSSIQVGYNTPTGADITPPAVSITSPTNGASVTSTILVSVSASDNVGVSVVNFNVDGALVGTDNSAPYNFSWNSSTVAAGIHSLSATATDAAGNVNSNSIQVTVNTTIIPPVTLPSSFQLIMPPVGNQGGEGSCMAWATAYARGAEKYYADNATSYNDFTNVLSPEYIYNQTKVGTDCGGGTSFTITLNLLINKGVCSWQSMPYSSVNGCSALPSAGQDAEAVNYKIPTYSTMYNTDITAIKTMIVNKHPILSAVEIDGNFRNASPGYIWNSFSSSSGDHGIVLCGYDDSKNAFKAINSWGTTWGDGGYIWIDYDFFKTISSFYLYVMN